MPSSVIPANPRESGGGEPESRDLDCRLRGNDKGGGLCIRWNFSGGKLDSQKQ